VPGVPPPTVVAPSPPSDSVWSVDFWFRKIIKIVTRSQNLRLCTKFYFGWGSGLCPRPTWESLQRSFSTGGATGGLGVTPLFENMGFAVCRNLHTVAWGGVGRNSERDRISSKKILKNACEPSIQADMHLRQFQIQLFSGEGRAPGFPAKLARMALVKRSPVSPVFRVPPFKPWLRHCPQTS